MSRKPGVQVKSLRYRSCEFINIIMRQCVHGVVVVQSHGVVNAATAREVAASTFIARRRCTCSCARCTQAAWSTAGDDRDIGSFNAAFGIARSSTERLAVDHRPTERPGEDRTLGSSLRTATSNSASVLTGTGCSPTPRIRMPGRSPASKRGTAGDNLVDLDQRAFPAVERRALAHAEPEDREHLGCRRKLGDLHVRRLRLAVAIVIHRDSDADIEAGRQVSQAGGICDVVFGQLHNHVIRFQPRALGRAAWLQPR